MLYLYKYVLILPCPVTIAEKFAVALILNFNLSAILGKKDFVIAPFDYTDIQPKISIDEISLLWLFCGC